MVHASSLIINGVHESPQASQLINHHPKGPKHSQNQFLVQKLCWKPRGAVGSGRGQSRRPAPGAARRGRGRCGRRGPHGGSRRQIGGGRQICVRLLHFCTSNPNATHIYIYIYYIEYNIFKNVFEWALNMHFQPTIRKVGILNYQRDG